MAKADKKGGAKSKLPKRIAGMKVPKTLRKSGANAVQWAASPGGREILGAMLVAAAAALTSSKKARGAISGGGKDAASGASRVGQALAGAAAEVVRRAIGGSEAEVQTTPAPAAGAASPAGTPARRGKNRPGPTFTH